MLLPSYHRNTGWLEKFSAEGQAGYEVQGNETERHGGFD